MRHFILLLVIGMILILAILLFPRVQQDGILLNEASEKQEEVQYDSRPLERILFSQEGEVISLQLAQREILLANAPAQPMSIDAELAVYDADGQPFPLRAIQKGYMVRVEGYQVSGQRTVTRMSVLRVPVLIVRSPAPHDLLTSPFLFEGLVRAGIGSLQYRLRDTRGQTLVQSERPVEAAPGMSVPFAFSVMFPVTTAKEGFFTVGLGAQGTQDHVEVVIPVRFAN